MSASFGKTIKAEDLEKAFLSGPGSDLVPKLIAQMSSIKQFKALFGPYDPKKQDQRWSDYQRFDWSVRQLPAMNVFESGSENKDSDNAFLRGSIQIQIFWPPNMRRSDLTRVPASFKAIVENFFSSQYCQSMLDELYYIQRPEKVFGLNELGKTLTWSPNVEGLVENEAVPVTILDISYRIDLRSWYRAMEFMGRTKANPFEVTLDDLSVVGGEYDGVPAKDGSDVKVAVPQVITVTNP